MNNPLLIGKGLPPFDEIKPEQVIPAVNQLLTELDQQLNELETNLTPTWETLVEPLTALGERLSWTWGIIGHLMGVKNSPELREAYEAVQPQLVQFSNKLSQSKVIYQGFKALSESKDWNQFTSAQKRIIESSIRDAELSGVGLEGKEKERFNEIKLELAELSTQFSNNVLDATKAFKLKLTTKEEIDGLPSSLLSLAAQ
ncbi:MAG: M3 family peptidase, partial [Microcystaceae cyanobacterium]